MPDPFNGSGHAPIPDCHLASASTLVIPSPGLPAMVEATQHHDIVLLDDKEKGVRESAKDGLAYLAMDLGKRLGEPENAGRCSVNGPRELGAQTLRPLLVPRTGL